MQPVSPVIRVCEGILRLLTITSSCVLTSRSLARRKISACAGFVFDKLRYFSNKDDLPRERWFLGPSYLGNRAECLISCKTSMDVAQNALTSMAYSCDTIKEGRKFALIASDCYEACSEASSFISPCLATVLLVEAYAEKVFSDGTLSHYLIHLGVSAACGTFLLTQVSRLSLGDALAAWACDKMLYDSMWTCFYVAAHQLRIIRNQLQR